MEIEVCIPKENYSESKKYCIITPSKLQNKINSHLSSPILMPFSQPFYPLIPENNAINFRIWSKL